MIFDGLGRIFLRARDFYLICFAALFHHSIYDMTLTINIRRKISKIDTWCQVETISLHIRSKCIMRSRVLIEFESFEGQKMLIRGL